MYRVHTRCITVINTWTSTALVPVYSARGSHMCVCACYLANLTARIQTNALACFSTRRGPIDRDAHRPPSNDILIAPTKLIRRCSTGPPSDTAVRLILPLLTSPHRDVFPDGLPVFSFPSFAPSRFRNYFFKLGNWLGPLNLLITTRRSVVRHAACPLIQFSLSLSLPRRARSPSLLGLMKVPT